MKLSPNVSHGAKSIRSSGQRNARGRGGAMPVTSAAPVRYCYRVSVSEGYLTTPPVTLDVGAVKGYLSWKQKKYI